MHAPSYRLVEPKSPIPGLPDAKAVEYTPEWSGGERPKPRVVGFVTPVEHAPTQYRHWRPTEPPVDRLFRPVASTTHAAARFLLPPSLFPITCVRCGVNEPCGDAAAHEQPGSHETYDGDLDDHCEDCLEEGQHELNEQYADERAADIVARSLGA